MGFFKSRISPGDFFWGGGGGGLRTLSSQGFDPLPTQRAPLCTILRYSCLTDGCLTCLADFKNFLSAPLAPNYTNFPKKFSNAFFFRPIFLKTCLRQRKFCQNVVFIVIRESSENQFGLPKKNVGKIFDFFQKSPLEPDITINELLLVSCCGFGSVPFHALGEKGIFSMSLERSAFIERFKFAYINIIERSEYSFKRLDDFFVVFFRKSLKICSRSIFFSPWQF